MNWEFLLGALAGIVGLIVYNANKKVASPSGDAALSQTEQELDKKINSAQQQIDNVRPIVRDPKQETDYYNNPKKD